MTQDEFEYIANFRVRKEHFDGFIYPMYAASGLSPLEFVSNLITWNFRKCFEYIPDEEIHRKEILEEIKHHKEELERFQTAREKANAAVNLAKFGDPVYKLEDAKALRKAYTQRIIFHKSRIEKLESILE